MNKEKRRAILNILLSTLAMIALPVAKWHGDEWMEWFSSFCLAFSFVYALYNWKWRRQDYKLTRWMKT